MEAQCDVIKWAMLETLASDDFGVWEVLLSVRNTAPSLPEAEADEAGAVAATELIHDGLAEMYYVTGGWSPGGAGVEQHPVSADAAVAVLYSAERTTVVVERDGEERAYWLRSTDAGVDACRSLWANRLK